MGMRGIKEQENVIPGMKILAMDAAAPGGAQSKNPDKFLSNQSSLMRRLIPRGGSITCPING